MRLVGLRSVRDRLYHRARLVGIQGGTNVTTYRERLEAGLHSAESREELEALTKAQLSERLDAKGLETTGTKAELLERLQNAG